MPCKGLRSRAARSVSHDGRSRFRNHTNRPQILRCQKPRSRKRIATTLLNGETETETEVVRALIVTTDGMADALEETITALHGHRLQDAATTGADDKTPIAEIGLLTIR